LAGSLLAMLSVPAWTPFAVGLNRTIKLTWLFGGIVKGESAARD
jgi:hypothetical protein